ncbi:MAG: hypothetical protein K1X91_15440 [Bacteriodetes bacterium]|nr:hypothetical protein [Bacteroidota bacterium]
MKAILSKIGLLLFGLVFLLPSKMKGQCDEKNQYLGGVSGPTMSDGSMDMKRAIDNSKFYPFYLFEIQNEVENIRYRTTEFKVNNQRLFLDKWCFKKSWNYNEATSKRFPEISNNELSNISRTKNFRINTGDIVTLYRDFWWYDLKNQQLNPHQIFSPDNLGYSIEIVDSKTENRIALLDSIFVYENLDQTSPRLFMMNPAISLIKYSVSNEFDGLEVFIRVNVISSGKQNMLFYRTDSKTIELSSMVLSDPKWVSFSNTVEKYNTNTTLHQDVLNNNYLTVTPSVSEGPITININKTDLITNDAYAITISDVTSNNILFTNRISMDNKDFKYTFNNPGVYVVNLSSSGSIISTKKVLIIK